MTSTFTFLIDLAALILQCWAFLTSTTPTSPPPIRHFTTPCDNMPDAPPDPFSPPRLQRPSSAAPLDRAVKMLSLQVWRIASLSDKMPFNKMRCEKTRTDLQHNDHLLTLSTIFYMLFVVMFCCLFALSSNSDSLHVFIHTSEIGPSMDEVWSRAVGVKSVNHN